jgi:hypothetical protein
VLVWAAWLTLLAAVLVVWTPGDPIEWTPFVGAAAGAWLLGLTLLVRGRAREGRLVPDYSPPTVLLALGLSGLVIGSSYGVWLLLVGAGLLAAGVVGVGRETLAARRLRR